MRKFTLLLLIWGIWFVAGCTSTPAPTTPILLVPTNTKIPLTSPDLLSTLIASVTSTPASPLPTSTPTPPLPITPTLRDDIPPDQYPKVATNGSQSPTPSPRPTLTEAESDSYVSELLSTNGGCDLPCFWRITPGVTSMVDAMRFFAHLGSNWEGDYYYNGTVFSMNRDLDDQHFSIGIDLYEQNGIVDTLHVSIAGETYLDRVQYYAFKQIILTNGIPSQIWINLATGLEIGEPEVTSAIVFLFYQQAGILVKYGGSAIKNGSLYRFCPTHPYLGNPYEEETGGSLSITLGPLGKGRPAFQLIAPFGPFDGMLTIDKALGLSNEEFYNAVVQTGDPVCFVTPRDVWP